MNIIIVCQWFPPEYAPIGVMLKELGLDLVANGHKVTVVTGFPNHPTGIIFDGYKKKIWAREYYGGLKIIRCFIYTSPIKTVLSRMLNYISFAVSSSLTILLQGKTDLILVVSPPLTNGLIARFLKWAKRCKLIFNVQDIYPDAAIAAGIITNKRFVGFLHKLEDSIYKDADIITVISRNFKENLLSKGVPASKIRVIYNWIDASEISPKPKKNNFSLQHELYDKFVVLYSGTIGLISGAEILVECAEQLNPFADIVIVFVGDGVSKEIIVELSCRKKLTNIKFIPFQPRNLLPEVLSCSDLSIVSLKKDKAKTSVPSKILGYMAAAKPIVASIDPDSDTSQFINMANCGLCVPPEDPDSLTNAILSLYHNPALASRLGQNGREFMLKSCERKSATSQYLKVMEECWKG